MWSGNGFNLSVFALLENCFAYSVAFHFGSSLTSGLKSVLSMAERHITNWNQIPDPPLISECAFWSTDLAKLGFVGRGEERGCRVLACAERTVLWISPAVVAGFFFCVWLPLPFLSQVVSEFGCWRLSRKHRLDFSFLQSGHFSLCCVGAWSGIKLSSVSCVPWPGNNQCNRLKCRKKTVSKLLWMGREAQPRKWAFS